MCFSEEGKRPHSPNKITYPLSHPSQDTCSAQTASDSAIAHRTQCLNSSAPSYLADQLRSVADNEHRARLRSAGDLTHTTQDPRGPCLPMQSPLLVCGTLCRGTLPTANPCPSLGGLSKPNSSADLSPLNLLPTLFYPGPLRVQFVLLPLSLCSVVLKSF